MQIQTGPAIPIKPRHLSDTDNKLNSDKSDDMKTTLNTHKDDDRIHTIYSLPRQQHDVTYASSHSKQPHQMNSQNSNGKTIYISPRRPKATLTIHHLYLYSSSCPDNLLANNNKPSKFSAGLGHGGGQRASLQAQTSSATGIQSSTPTYLNGSYNINPGAGLKSSHARPSQWNSESHGILHSGVKTESPGVSKFQSMPISNPPGSSPILPFSMDSSSPSYSSQNSTKTTPHFSNKGNNSNKLESVIAQLVEMGFSVADVKRAIASSKDHTIQSYLDILVQKGSTTTDDDRHHHHQRNQGTSVQPPYHQQKKTTFESTPFTKLQASSPSSSTLNPSPSPTKTESRYHMHQGYGNLDDNSSDNDEHLSNDVEWQQQQEARRRNYLDSLKKQQQQQHQHQESRPKFEGPPSTSSYAKPIPTTPPPLPQSFQYTKTPLKPSTTAQPTSSTPPPSRPTSSSGVPMSRPIDPNAIKKAIKARARGNDIFKLGYYREAEKSYNQALALLPDRHDITAIISNNRAAARLKNGQYRQCVMDCTFVIDWARQKCTSEGKTATIELDGGISIRWYDQLGKALHRKAEALEKMVRSIDAQLIYQELVNMDSGDTKARTGLHRCQSATETKNTPPPPPFSKPTSTHTSSTPARETASSSTAFPDLDYSIFEVQQPNVNDPPPSKAVAAMRARQAEMVKEETERLEKMDMVNARIDSWKRGKEKNIRALLSSLDTLLWPGAQWRGAPVNELLEPRKVKMCYMKAIAKVHPDKLPSSTTVEQRLLASGIFSVLNQAWDDFRSNNKI